MTANTTDVPLDERKAAILTRIVRGYVHNGEPVGSKRLSEELNLGVSSATVRSEMAALEDSGYITQPHTSAGRVPTDLGYRYFVDTLNRWPRASTQERLAVEELLFGADDLEDLLRRASSVLSRLTRFAALVVAPGLDTSKIRHVELVHLGPHSVLAVLIADTGRVDKRMLALENTVSEADVQRARQVVNEAVSGLNPRHAAEVVAGIQAAAPLELADLLSAVADTMVRSLARADSGDQVFFGGTANIVSDGYFNRMEEIKQVYETIEEQVVVLGMLKDTLEAGDPAVRIGGELPLVELTACSVVAASYETDKGAGGSLGVLGPTRMDYPRTLAAVQAVASSLEKALAELVD